MADKPEALRMADSLDKFSNPWDKEIASELRRLHQFERGYNEWTEKTQWVQETQQTHELGMHRADVLKQRIERLETVNQELLEALKDLTTAQDLNAYGMALHNARAAIAKAEGEQK